MNRLRYSLVLRAEGVLLFFKADKRFYGTCFFRTRTAGDEMRMQMIYGCPGKSRISGPDHKCRTFYIVLAYQFLVEFLEIGPRRW